MAKAQAEDMDVEDDDLTPNLSEENE